MPAIHRKRCKRFDSPGDAHCLTFSCFHRLPLFTRPRSCQWMLAALDLGRCKKQFDLWAYVVMPEHAHVVLLPRDGTSISRILTTIKQSVSKTALRWLHENAPGFLARLEEIQHDGRRVHRFWQRGGGYDRNLRTTADIHEKIAYVHNNPVRRGLAATPEAWPWSSAWAWQTGRDEPIAIDRGSVPRLVATSKQG
jgi:putative transposase